MADVTLTYKGSDILELSNSGSATLKTGGKYCEGDIAVEYVKPSGESVPYLQHFQYVQAETKDYNSGGFTSWFVNTYINKGDGLYFGFINDVSQSTNPYKAVSFVVLIRTEGDIQGWFRRSNGWTTNINNEFSFYVFEGATIDVYFISKSDFEIGVET